MVKILIDLHEYIDEKTGEIIEISSPGHHDYKFFSDQCYLRHHIRPNKIRQTFVVYKNVKSKKHKSKRFIFISTCFECDERQYGSKPVTIGYFDKNLKETI